MQQWRVSACHLNLHMRSVELAQARMLFYHEFLFPQSLHHSKRAVALTNFHHNKRANAQMREECPAAIKELTGRLAEAAPCLLNFNYSNAAAPCQLAVD
eukprot:68986-Pelagomonas_calceolata.AAC.4